MSDIQKEKKKKKKRNRSYKNGIVGRLLPLSS